MSKYILIITALILFFIGCSKNPVDNPVNYNPSNCTYPPGQRNYIWQMDTVAWFPSSLGGVWAFSDSDAYVMGCIVNSTPPLTISLALHWNGKNWDNNINGNYSNM